METRNNKNEKRRRNIRSRLTPTYADYKTNEIRKISVRFKSHLQSYIKKKRNIEISCYKRIN